MSMRDKAAAILPGLVTARPPAPPQPRVFASAREASRAATMSLYNAIGPAFGGASLVPSLDHPTPGGMDPAKELRENPLLFAPEWRIAFRLGALPIKVFEFREDKGASMVFDVGKTQQTATTPGALLREEAPDHPAYKVLRTPNPDLPSNLLISGSVLSMFSHSRCGWWKERKNPNGPKNPSNPVVAVWPIPGHVLWPVRAPNRIIAGFEIRIQGYQPYPLDPADVCYFRLMPDPEDWAASLSPVGPLGDTLDFGMQALGAMSDLFQTAFLQRIWIDLHGEELEQEQLDRLRAEMILARQSRWGVPIMESGATIESMGTYGSTVEDALLGRAVDLSEKIVAHTFGLPENRDDLALFYGEVIQPIADVIEKELERSFMTEWPDRPAFPEFQFREILAGSPSDRASLHQKKILSGQETINEARRAENLPPIQGGDITVLPLNVGPLSEAPVTGENRKKDSTDGLGGAEGKGTTPSVPMPKAPVQKAAAADELAEIQAARNALARENWSTIRTRVLTGQKEALERRLRGLMKEEASGLRSMLDGIATDPRKGESVFREIDGKVAELLTGFNLQVAEEAWRQALDFVSADEIEPTAVEQMTTVIRERATEMTEAFGARRLDEFVKLVQEADDVKAAVKDRWDELANGLAGRLSETQATWAFEQAVARAWTEAGWAEFALVRDKEGCRTGVCDQAVTQRYTVANVPTPLHHECGCMVLPVQFVE